MSSRRFFLGTLGVEFIKVPRSQNPYAVARRIRRYLQGNEIAPLKKLAATMRRPVPPVTPDMDTPEPVPGDDDAVAAE